MKSARKSSIELARIVAMLAIVAGHWFWQSGAEPALRHSFVANFLGCGQMVGVNLFLLIGCWFMVDTEFSLKRPIRLYLAVITYTVPLTILALACGAQPGMKDVARGFLPFTGRALWFASAYISLMVLTPWLHRAFELPRRSLGLLLAVSFVLVCGVCTLPDAQDTYLCQFSWFICVYLLVGGFKFHLASRMRLGGGRVIGLLFSAGLIYAILVFVRVIGPSLGQWGSLASKLATYYLMDFKTLPNFLASWLIFLAFLSVDLGSIAVVNWLARSAFAVYVIHQTPAFYPYLWKATASVSPWLLVPAVYLGACLVEPHRAAVVDKLCAWLGLLTGKHAEGKLLRLVSRKTGYWQVKDL